MSRQSVGNSVKGSSVASLCNTWGRVAQGASPFSFHKVRAQSRRISHCKYSGYTLVELTVALCVAAIVLTIGGRLLFDGLDSWQRELGRSAAERRVMLALDALADDLVSQVDYPHLPSPVKSFEIGSNEWECVSLLIAGRDVTLGPRSVCWYLRRPKELEDGGERSVWTLFRVELSEEASASALPANAAEALVKEAAQLVQDGDAQGAAVLLGNDDASAIVMQMCQGALGLKMEESSLSSGASFQVVLTALTLDGYARIIDGSLGEGSGELPERFVVSKARPVRCGGL